MGAVQLRDGGWGVTRRHEDLDRLLTASGDIESVARRLETIDDAFPRRVVADPEKVEQGLAQLVLTLIELLRQLMERQALRRMDVGDLSDEQIERLGMTFMRLAERMDELKQTFGLRDEDLNLDLGPIGSLL
jgi:Gas vesicle protein K